MWCCYYYYYYYIALILYLLLSVISLENKIIYSFQLIFYISIFYFIYRKNGLDHFSQLFNNSFFS